jgi:nucleoid DNA-binding protein
MKADELIVNITSATNQTRGSVYAVLAELDDQIEHALKSGRIVHLPNGTHYKPTGKKDGLVDCDGGDFLKPLAVS